MASVSGSQNYLNRTLVRALCTHLYNKQVLNTVSLSDSRKLGQPFIDMLYSVAVGTYYRSREAPAAVRRRASGAMGTLRSGRDTRRVCHIVRRGRDMKGKRR
jgi:hypothetical protein